MEYRKNTPNTFKGINSSQNNLISQKLIDRERLRHKKDEIFKQNQLLILKKKRKELSEGKPEISADSKNIGLKSDFVNEPPKRENMQIRMPIFNRLNSILSSNKNKQSLNPNSAQSNLSIN